MLHLLTFKKTKKNIKKKRNQTKKPTNRLVWFNKHFFPEIRGATESQQIWAKP